MTFHIECNDCEWDWDTLSEQAVKIAKEAHEEPTGHEVVYFGEREQ